MRHTMYRIAHALKTGYVTLLLFLLPLILRVLRGTRVIRREAAVLPSPFTFRLCVSGSSCTKTILLTCDTNGRFHFARSQAETTQPGPDFTIKFVSVEDAFKVFSGGMTLREAVATHALSTQGNLSQGVSLTYMFDFVLQTFFFWRSAYARI